MLKPQLRQLLPDQARLRMADLCSRSEHCRADIADRLARHGISPTDSEAILDFLCRNGFISDERFAKAFVADKVRFNAWGRIRIARELYMKGVDREAVKNAIDGIDYEQYHEAAMKAARSKCRSIDIDSREGKMKLYRFMASKGYESSVISAVIERIRKEEI